MKQNNTLAAIASFIVPGLGQLFQGRFLAGIAHFVVACLLWLVLLGWVMNFYSAYSAATRSTERQSITVINNNVINK